MPFFASSIHPLHFSATPFTPRFLILSLGKTKHKKSILKTHFCTMDVSYTIHTSAEKTMTIAQSPSLALPSNSPWHSPVPYLFGGLAAMLGLIAFALLILACSYWRLSGYFEGGSNGERDLEAGEGNTDDDADLKIAKPVFGEKFLVIMPGQQKPTCLATPMSGRASSFGSTTGSSDTSCSSASSEKKEESDELRQQIEMGNVVASHESAGNQEDHHQIS